MKKAFSLMFKVLGVICFMSLTNTVSAQLALPPLVGEAIAQQRIDAEVNILRGALQVNPSDVYLSAKNDFLRHVQNSMVNDGMTLVQAINTNYTFRGSATSDFAAQNALTLPVGQQKQLLQETITLLQ